MRFQPVLRHCDKMIAGRKTRGTTFASYLCLYEICRSYTKKYCFPNVPDTTPVFCFFKLKACVFADKYDTEVHIMAGTVICTSCHINDSKNYNEIDILLEYYAYEVFRSTRPNMFANLASSMVTI